MMTPSFDFAAAWHTLTANDPTHRGETAVDLAFWRTHAQTYDEKATAPGCYEQTLAAIQNYLCADDILLDVGAGTGRFAIPLAQTVQHITALDHAAPMLAILRQKMVRHNIHNICLQEVAWEEADVPVHDVVLAAWSLYRLPDIVVGMHRLVAATRRTLIIVTSPGNMQGDKPMHLYFYGILWQMGLYPEMRVVWERPCDEAQPVPVALIIWQRRVWHE